MRFPPFFPLEACRILMMEWDYRKGLQFYTDLTELTVELGSLTDSFVSERTSEREALVGRLEAEKRLSAVETTSLRPPLAAKRPPPRPPPFKPYSLDGALDALNFWQEPSQQTQQQWQNKGGIPSPPPPPAPNRSLPPPTSSPLRSIFFPPPPLPPVFPGMSQPGQDLDVNLEGFVGTGSNTPIHPPAGQSVPPQPPLGQGALPPSLGNSVSCLPAIANLDCQQPLLLRFPAAVSPVQSPPLSMPRQQPQVLYPFTQFVSHESQRVRNRRNSEVSQLSQVTVSDETHMILKSKTGFLFH